jgi:hypothetical protein
MRDKDVMDCLLRIEAYLEGIHNMMEAKREDPKKDNKVSKDHIKEVYEAYPSRCVVSNRSSGKCAKNKEKIKNLLKEMPYGNLIALIQHYTDDCMKTDTYMKNFSTFLNNLPDITELNKKPESKKVKSSTFEEY